MGLRTEMAQAILEFLGLLVLTGLAAMEVCHQRGEPR